MTTSPEDSQTWQSAAQHHYAERGKLGRMAERLGLLNLLSHHEEQEKNRESESRAIREGVWGQPVEGEEVGGNILGDVSQQPPVIITGQGNNLSPLLLAAALGVGGPVAAAAGAAGMYLWDKASEQKAPSVQYEDETIKLGLGRIEELSE